MKDLLSYALFFYVLLNFSLTFVWPSYRVWKKTGVFPVTFSNQDTAHDFIGNVFKLLLLLLVVTVGIYAFYEDGVKYLLPVWYLQTPLVQWAGIAILLIALVWIAVAQRQMSNSWRIGIDEKNKTDLVTAGVFALSRNPIFLGMLCTLLGLFLVIPNAITFCVLITGIISVQVQVRLEEEFLTRLHGQDYVDYCSKTRRWIGFQ